MSKFLTIQQTANLLGVSNQTLRRWEKEKRLIPSHRTSGGQRRYDAQQIQPHTVHKIQHPKPTIAYARVSSHDQKEDLERQVKMLEMYCSAQGWSFSIIKDLGSGMNYQKKGLKSLLEKILDGKLGRLVLTHKDRLLRFGAELVFSLCAVRGVEVILINQGDEPTFEEELAKDVLEIITVFSARLYGSRSRKNKRLLEDLQRAVTANG
jgi:putative resolvase